jgi:Glycosyltransferase family 10 (fucosyltransferase) C-term
MIRAAFLSADHWVWSRQFPGHTTTWDGVEFCFGAERADCECVFVFNALPEPLFCTIDPRHLAFVASEPPNVKRYNPHFLGQFGLILTTDRQSTHPNRHFTQVGLPWHVGAWGSGGNLLASPMHFTAFECFLPPKTKLLSVVSSNKAFTEEHRNRLKFVSELKNYFGSQIDVFGRGINDFDDKLHVLAPYRYHVALENCAIPHYWTEKLADPFLTLTYPLYHGCPNIDDYFAPGSLTRINIYEPQAAIATIKRIIESDRCEQSAALLVEARRRVLFEHNLFALLARTAKEMLGGQPRRPRNLLLQPENTFQPRRERLRPQLVRAIRAIPPLYRVAHTLRNASRSLKDMVRRARS